MVIIRGLTEAVSWLSAPISNAWHSAEPILIVPYLLLIAVIGLWLCFQEGRGAKVLGAAVLVLLMGEAYRLIPRIVEALAPFFQPWADQSMALGIGQLISTLSRAGFFLLLEIYRQRRVGASKDKKWRRAEHAIYVLFGVAAAVCYAPFNEWVSGEASIFWMILRNVFPACMGVISIVLWRRTAQTETAFRHLPTALTVAVIFSLPATILAKLVPEAGALMIPRTLAVIWALLILRNATVIRGTGYSFKTYFKRYWTLYALLFLPIVFFALFRYYPMSYISLAFKQNNTLMHPWRLELAAQGGMEHFLQAFGDVKFLEALFNTIFLNLLDLVIGMPMPIIMALLLNELSFPKYKRITQTILYLPHFLSWVIIATIAKRLFGTTYGIVNQALGTNIKFLEENSLWRGMYIFLGIWKECGWNTIIYLAALTGINAELYEAAEVDGASRLKKIWHVTLPGIRPTIIVLLIMNLGRILGSDFDRPYTLGNTQVLGASTTISIFVYERGINGGQFSLSTAVGLFQSVVCVIFLVASNTLSKKFGERGIW